MKKLITYILICVSFIACDVVEEIKIDEHNSGEYIINMDMSRVVTMMKSMGQSENEGDDWSGGLPGMGGGKETITDSIISMKPQIDTATSLSPAQKKVLSRSYIRMNVNDKRVHTAIVYPFASPEEYLIILKAIGDQPVFSEGAEYQKLMEAGEPGKLLSYLLSGSNMPVYMDKGKMERVLQSADTFLIKPKIGNGSGNNMADMMMSLSLKTVLHLPSPVKTYRGGKSISVSDDKRRIEIIHLNADSKELKASELAYSVTY